MDKSKDSSSNVEVCKFDSKKLDTLIEDFKKRKQSQL